MHFFYIIVALNMYLCCGYMFANRSHGLLNSTTQMMKIELNEGQAHLLHQIPILIANNTVFPISITLPVKTVMENFAKNSSPIILPKKNANKKTKSFATSKKKVILPIKKGNLRNGYANKPFLSRNLRGSPSPVNGEIDYSIYNPPNAYCYSIMHSIKSLVKI